MNRIIKLATLSVALFLANENISAQGRPEPAGRIPDEMREELKASPEERATKASKRMGKFLSLDASTQQKVYDLLLVRANEVDKAMALQGRERHQAMKATQDKYETAMQGVLTAEQFESLKKVERQMRDRQGKGRGPRGGNKFRPEQEDNK